MGVFIDPTPGEFSTVLLGTTFPVDVRLTDPDGIDSIWITLDPNVNTLQRFGGYGDTSKTVGVTILMPPTMVPPAGTLYVHVQGLDLNGDSGVVLTRRLLIQ